MTTAQYLNLSSFYISQEKVFSSGLCAWTINAELTVPGPEQCIFPGLIDDHGRVAQPFKLLIYF